MDHGLHYDVAFWETHETEEDCLLVIRTNTGIAFYCQIFPAKFINSPKVTREYFHCLNLLRSGEEEINDFYIEDACDWLTEPFRPLIAKLASNTPSLGSGHATLRHYLYPPSFDCGLKAVQDSLQAYITDKKGYRESRAVIIDDIFSKDLDQWTRCYNPSDIKVCYERPEDILIKPPARVIAGETVCFFKRLEVSFGAKHAKSELMALKRTASLPDAPVAYICRLHGVVRNGQEIAGMLFTWIEKKGVLCQTRAKDAPTPLRRRWADQISRSLQVLHEQGIVWGDAKADNVLIDQDDNAWIIDFGGSYTAGWVDKDKAGTIEGDMQGLEKILDMLS